MESISVSIKNCNNIKNGKLIIKNNILNIKYGINGTGKSTISEAIKALCKNEKLDFLQPFGSSEETKPECIISKSYKNVMVFDESFVNDIVFKSNSVIQNSFEVFLRTPDYILKRESLEQNLSKLKNDIGQQDEVKKLKKDLDDFCGKLELNAAKTQLKNNTHLKAILKKKNIYNVPKELESYEPIISDDNLCINWIDWKTKGVDFDTKGICPFCSEKLGSDYKEEKKIFLNTYKKSDSRNLKEMLDEFIEFKQYLIEEKAQLLIDCIQSDKDSDTINKVFKGFMDDYEYVSQKLNNIYGFDTSIFRGIEISKIDKLLNDMKIEKSALNYFGSTLMLKIIDLINDNIDEICKEAISIKKSMGELQTVLRTSIKESKKDIDEFLQTAGMDYELEINLEENGTAISTLKYKGESDVNDIRGHLSWGERNAFALILFMFYALSQKADLIILDDPISSFDTNKKYAIIHRMFEKPKGVLPRSFYKQTVVMLTHDFEPIIDFIVLGKLSRDNVKASVIRNIDGKLDEVGIDSNQDIKPVVVELKEHVLDDDLDKVIRIAFLRKLYEHIGKDEHMAAYTVLSSLIHGSDKCTDKDLTDISEKDYEEGTKDINEWIGSFDYYEYVKKFYNLKYLTDLYFKENNSYLKIIIFRELFEIGNGVCINNDDILIKYIHESYHIENDYAYYLNMLKFPMVPDYIIHKVNDCMNTFVQKQ